MERGDCSGRARGVLLIPSLRELREAVGLTAGQLAAKVGVPVATVGAWERGAATPEARQLGRLAQALGVAPEAVRAAFGGVLMQAFEGRTSQAEQLLRDTLAGGPLPAHTVEARAVADGVKRDR